jgi:FMN phosphatase YigB (HAD superfamily)
VADFLAALERHGIAVAVLSDYPAEDKLRCLDLAIDCVVSATDPEVERLKPHPRGLQRILELTGVAAERAVLIGDRDDRDGECARRAGVSYLLRSSRPATNGHEFGSYAELERSLHRGRATKAALE